NTYLLGFLRLIILQNSFEYAWGKFSFSQSNFIKIAKVQSHLKMVCEEKNQKQICAPYITVDLRRMCELIPQFRVL
ncbi:MAG: hypothetical protein AB2693_11750, partial [Candidatus Thiodiazotropha sp.]